MHQPSLGKGNALAPEPRMTRGTAARGGEKKPSAHAANWLSNGKQIRGTASAAAAPAPNASGSAADDEASGCDVGGALVSVRFGLGWHD
jgi:hypothetical protein